MKPFSSWISDMADKYEDASIVLKYKNCNCVVSNTSKPSDAMKRLAIADMLVPSTYNKEDVTDWLSALCVTMRGNSGCKSLVETFLKDIVGQQLAGEWLVIDSNTDAISFKIRIKQLIQRGDIV